jgi:tetratricopeptide (TPR) repeat protein
MKPFIWATFIGLLMIAPLAADDGALKEALDKANRGDQAEAIVDLEKLKTSNPSDGRIALSLGLLYQTTDQHDKAIAELERAKSLEPTLQGTYALGLLYESKWVQAEQDVWKQKAMATWEDYLRTAARDDSRRAVVEKHLEKLRNNG